MKFMSTPVLWKNSLFFISTFHIDSCLTQYDHNLKVYKSWNKENTPDFYCQPHFEYIYDVLVYLKVYICSGSLLLMLQISLPIERTKANLLHFPTTSNVASS